MRRFTRSFFDVYRMYPDVHQSDTFLSGIPSVYVTRRDHGSVAFFMTVSSGFDLKLQERLVRGVLIHMMKHRLASSNVPCCGLRLAARLAAFTVIRTQSRMPPPPHSSWSSFALLPVFSQLSALGLSIRGLN